MSPRYAPPPSGACLGTPDNTVSAEARSCGHELQPRVFWMLVPEHYGRALGGRDLVNVDLGRGVIPLGEQALGRVGPSERVAVPRNAPPARDL